MNILVVEDDAVLGGALAKGLNEAGHDCQWTQSGTQAVELGRNHDFDIVVLDLLLPDLPGLEVLHRLRAIHPRIAVLILTALGAIDDRVAGLNAGADDYLVKPFAFPELLARLSAIKRRNVSSAGTELQVGSLSVELTSRTVKRNGKQIELTPTEYKMLEFLVRHANQVVTRRMLCEHLWDSDWEGVTNVIEVHINRLRNKLNKGFESDLIHTVRGSGYELRSD